MADLKLGSQIGGNLIWHQGILELNPLDDSLFYKEFDLISSKGGQTINGGMSLKGVVDTTAQYIGVGVDTSWQGGSANAAFQQQIDNTTGAHWLLASRRKNGSARAGIQVLTNDAGNFRIYTNNLANYTDFGGGQISIQATTPSSAAHATRKDYVDKEIDRAMTFAETTTDKLTADLATANTKIDTLDAQNVKITGDQTISGVKRFNAHIFVPTADPTLDTQLTHKAYVDKKVGTAVQGIATTAPLATTGGVNPTLSIAAATRTAAGSMSAQDKVKLDDLPADALSRSGGTMKNNGIIKLDGIGGINSLTGGKEYSIFRDHNNGNVTVSGAGGDLYIGYKTDAELYTTRNVLLYSPLKWTNTNRVLVDIDGFIPWASIKDRIGLEGKSKKLVGPINFDEYELTGDYNLYSARKDGSVNPPPFDYGTMSVVGSDKDGGTFVTQTATDQRTGKVYVRTRNDGKMEWTDWRENLTDLSEMGYNYHQKFTVEGDANTFYPVAIGITGGNSWYSWKRYCFSRSYSAKAPDTWNNKTHKGGLTLEFQMSNDSGWGGNSHNIVVNEFNQTYTTVCGGMALTTGSMIVWLRGGGAEYMFHSDEGNKTAAVVNLEKYIAADKKEFLPRTMEEANAANLAEIMPRYSIRNGEVYDKNRRVMVPDSDVGLTIRNGAPMIQFIETDQTNKTYFMVADGGGIRLQEDSTGATGKNLFNYTPAWEGINLLKPFVNEMGTGTKSLVTKEYADAIDAKNVDKAGDSLTGNMTFTNDSQLIWSRNSDYAKFGFKNDSDQDADSYMWFESGDNGNEYFKFRTVSGSTKKDLFDLKIGKAEFHVPIVADEVKNAINVHGKGSISFQDAANTRFHIWADGNFLKFNHGINAETTILGIQPDGNVTTVGSFTAKDFIQSTPQLANGAASTRKDYVDAQIAAVDAKNVAKTGDTMTGTLAIRKDSASSMCLNLSNETDGWTWINFGASNAQGTKSCHVAWNTTAYDGATANAFHIRPGGGTAMSFGTDTTRSHKLLAAANNFTVIQTAPYMELHKPGAIAFSWNIAADNRLMLSQTNGAGVAHQNILGINAGNNAIRINANQWSNASGHAYASIYAQDAPLTVDFGYGPGASDYYPMIKGSQVVTNQGYTTAVTLGILRSGANRWGDATLTVGNGESAGGPIQLFQFGIDGTFRAPGGVFDSGNRCYSASNPVPAGNHNHANLRARDAAIIWDGDIGNGNFTMNRPWTDFDFVCFCVLWDDYGGLSTKTFSRYDLEINQAIGVNYDISGGAGGIQWMGRFDPNGVSFYTSYENGRMRRIYGYNMGTIN